MKVIYLNIPKVDNFCEVAQQADASPLFQLGALAVARAGLNALQKAIKDAGQI